MMRRLIAIAAGVLLGGAMSFGAEFSLAHVFSSHMVFQRETSAPVWGWGEPGATVTVVPSWNGEEYSTTVDKDGSWKVHVSTAEAGGPYSVAVRCGSACIDLEDVLLGEVWICTGQSNMEMPIAGFGFQQVDGAREAIIGASEKAGRIRVFDLKTPKQTEPIADVDATWQSPTGGVCARTSAIGWFFADNLSASLGVPVGIIVNAWGGSRIEPWMTREAIDRAGLTEDEMAEILSVQEKADRWPETPQLIWNGRMAPIAGFAARGFLWYQGCSNMWQRYCYDKLQTSMVRLWRDAWGRGEMPFLYVLLAPYDHGDKDGRARPHFVQTQMRAAVTTPSAWAVCTETYGDEVTIHPSRKREVADMLALKALSSVYGIDQGIPVDYPTPSSYDFGADGTVTVLFDNVWNNLMSISRRRITGFELAGQDREFHPAEAEVDWDGQTVRVWCDDVPAPVAVRYSFRNWCGSNMQTSYGIPVPPFRSDDWEY